MAAVVLVAWLVQALAGTLALRRWVHHGARGSRGARGARRVGLHVVLAVGALASWVTFVATQHVLWGWSAFVLVSVGNAVGDSLLVRRSRALLGAGASWRADYGAAVGAVFAGRFPRLVTFHAVFAGVVYFASLAACIVASR